MDIRGPGYRPQDSREARDSFVDKRSAHFAG